MYHWHSHAKINNTLSCYSKETYITKWYESKHIEGENADRELKVNKSVYAT